MRPLATLVIAVLSLSLISLAADNDKTYKPDDEGYIHNWLITEPIKLSEDVSEHSEDQEKPVFEKPFAKKDHSPKAGDKLKAGDQEVAWAAKESTEPILDLAAAFEGKENEGCMYLGVAYVMAPQEMKDVKLSIGSDDSSVWKLNGKEVIRIYAGRDCEKDTDQSPALTLNKGANVVHFALTQGNGPTAVVARFIDKEGKPVKDLAISLSPKK